MTRSTINRLLVLAGIVAFAILFRTLPVTEWLERLARLNEQYPVAVPVAYIAAVTVATVALFPGWISMMLGGLFSACCQACRLRCWVSPLARSAGSWRDGRWDVRGSRSAWATA